MKPIFTIHEGEFLVGDYIIRNISTKYDVWVPAKDSGVDILLTDIKNRRKPIKLQVKFSRSYKTRYIPPEQLKARGWFTLKPEKIKNSRADVWVFVVFTLQHQSNFILIPTKELIKRIPRKCGKIWHIYLTAFADKSCYNLRGLSKVETQLAVENGIKYPERDYTKYLNNWKMLDKIGK